MAKLEGAMAGLALPGSAPFNAWLGELRVHDAVRRLHCI